MAGEFRWFADGEQRVGPSTMPRNHAELPGHRPTVREKLRSYSNLPESGLSSPVVAACAGIAAEMVPNLRRLTSEETLTHGPLAAKAGSEKIGSDSNILVAHDASSMGVKHGEEYILLKQQMNLTLTTAPAHACGACGQKTPWGDSSSSSLKAPVATRSTPGKK